MYRSKNGRKYTKCRLSLGYGVMDHLSPPSTLISRCVSACVRVCVEAWM